MRYDAQLAAEVEQYLALPLTVQRSGPGLTTLASLWARAQGQPAGSCRQCQYSDYRRDVAAYVREFSQLPNSPATMSDQTRKYHLNPAFAGQSFVHEDWGKVVTADNYDDKDAEFFRGKGRTDAFVEVGATSSDSPADESTEVDHQHPLVPQAHLEAEQQAHTSTQEALEAEKQAYTKLVADYNGVVNKCNDATAALASEKESHSHTKGQLAEAQRQLTEVQKQLDKEKGKRRVVGKVEEPAKTSDGAGAGQPNLDEPSTPGAATSTEAAS